MSASEIKEIMQEYRRLRAVVPLGSLRTKKEYERAVEMLDAILDEIGDDDRHPMAQLADAISVFSRDTRTSTWRSRPASLPRC